MLILFVCVENAGRSQIAEAYAKKFGANAISAGTLPALEINPTVAATMKEDGFDPSNLKPKVLTNEMIESASVIVTMGCAIQDVCPTPLVKSMRKTVLEWHIEDPKHKPIEKVREIRDDIKNKVLDLLHQQGA
jgi:protein-tyrosine-phosphatase